MISKNIWGGGGSILKLQYHGPQNLILTMKAPTVARFCSSKHKVGRLNGEVGKINLKAGS